MTNTTPVTYTGRETPFVDRIYGSKLSFDPGQTRHVPGDLAERLLRHADVFKVADTEEASSTEKPDDTQQDDTAQLLEEAEKEKQAREEAERQRNDLVAQIESMDKDALQQWAHEKFGQKVPKTLSVENMRAQVVGFIDQFGTP